jgi:hypothetical protein
LTTNRCVQAFRIKPLSQRNKFLIERGDRIMRGRWVGFVCMIAFCGLMVGCATDGGGSGGPQSASQKANQQADQARYQPIAYANAATPGPLVIVLPGEIKSSNATFTQKVTANNIADFAEIELEKDGFQVLERGQLGPMLQEIQLAFGMGDPQAMKKFQKGKFKSTKWFLKFDIIKAEPVAAVQQGFSGAPLGAIAGALIGGNAGYATAVGASSVQTGESAGVWLVGLRYKVMDANTTEQKASGYFEEKMEIGAKSSSVLGVSQSQQNVQTLDGLAQRLVQMAVADLDMKCK